GGSGRGVRRRGPSPALGCARRRAPPGRRPGACGSVRLRAWLVSPRWSAGPAADAPIDKTFARRVADVQDAFPVPGALAAGLAPPDPPRDECMPRVIISQFVWQSSEFRALPGELVNGEGVACAELFAGASHADPPAPASPASAAPGAGGT